MIKINLNFFFFFKKKEIHNFLTRKYVFLDGWISIQICRFNHISQVNFCQPGNRTNLISQENITIYKLAIPYKLSFGGPWADLAKTHKWDNIKAQILPPG